MAEVTHTHYHIRSERASAWPSLHQQDRHVCAWHERPRRFPKQLTIIRLLHGRHDPAIQECVWSAGGERQAGIYIERERDIGMEIKIYGDMEI